MKEERWGEVPPQSFPTPDVHDIVRHIFMGTEINNNNGINCYQAIAVFLPPASGNSVPSQHLQVNEQRNSKIKCDTLITFSIEIVLSNNS
jgi:hypothetical protein